MLIERGRTVNEKDDLPALARAAQEALGLHPLIHYPGPDGSDAVKKILGAVSTIATGLGELRNRGYGTGHGPAAARVGLRARHAHLAVTVNDQAIPPLFALAITRFPLGTTVVAAAGNRGTTARIRYHRLTVALGSVVRPPSWVTVPARIAADVRKTSVEPGEVAASHEVEGKVAGGRRGSTSVYQPPDRRRPTRLESTSVNRDRRPVDDSYLALRGTALERQLGE